MRVSVKYIQNDGDGDFLMDYESANVKQTKAIVFTLDDTSPHFTDYDSCLIDIIKACELLEWVVIHNLYPYTKAEVGDKFHRLRLSCTSSSELEKLENKFDQLLSESPLFLFIWDKEDTR